MSGVWVPWVKMSKEIAAEYEPESAMRFDRCVHAHKTGFVPRVARRRSDGRWCILLRVKGYTPLRCVSAFQTEDEAKAFASKEYDTLNDYKTAHTRQKEYEEQVRREKEEDRRHEIPIAAEQALLLLLC